MKLQNCIEILSFLKAIHMIHRFLRYEHLCYLLIKNSSVLFIFLILSVESAKSIISRTMPVRPLPAPLAAKAQLELNEDPSRLQSDLEHMKDWISKHPLLRARTGSTYLLIYKHVNF